MDLMCFFTKSITVKQFEGSRIKRMCIFRMLTVRGLPGSEGASASCTGLPGNAMPPGYAPDTVRSIFSPYMASFTLI